MASRLKLVRSLSFTASTDWFYRHFFAYSGLRSVTADFGDGTIMHCWTPKIPKTTKPDLLLVHGFGANAMWQYGDVLRQFINKFNVYVPDLLFFGRSWTTRPERTEQFQAQSVMRLMEMLEVRRMSLVGISYGGFVGYSMAVQFPSAIDKLALCCTGVALEEKDMKTGLFQVSDVEAAANILVPQTPEKLRDLMDFAFASPVKRVPTFFLSDYIDVMCTDHVKEKKELVRAILEDRQFSDLPKITQPTLIIWGDQDKIFPLELAYRLQRHIERSELEVIKKAGHALNVEKPREFSKHMKKFLVDSDPCSTTPHFIHRSFWSR